MTTVGDSGAHRSPFIEYFGQGGPIDAQPGASFTHPQMQGRPDVVSQGQARVRAIAHRTIGEVMVWMLWYNRI